MIRQQPMRQRIRKGVILTTFILFPIIMNYFSPYVIIDGASQGIVNGSFIVFGLMFLVALVLGRAWCGWVCPAGGLQEAVSGVNNGPFKTGKRDWIKWFIWAPWIGIIVTICDRSGRLPSGGFLPPDRKRRLGDRADAVHHLPHRRRHLLRLAVLMGRRAGCHTICWMAPFMIIGRKIRNLVAWPSLRLVAQSASCKDCLKCTSNCPMSLDVHGMVQRRTDGAQRVHPVRHVRRQLLAERDQVLIQRGEVVG